MPSKKSEKKVEKKTKLPEKDELLAIPPVDARFDEGFRRGSDVYLLKHSTDFNKSIEDSPSYFTNVKSDDLEIQFGEFNGYQTMKVISKADGKTEKDDVFVQTPLANTFNCIINAKGTAGKVPEHLHDRVFKQTDPDQPKPDMHNEFCVSPGHYFTWEQDAEPVQPQTTAMFKYSDPKRAPRPYNKKFIEFVEFIIELNEQRNQQIVFMFLNGKLPAMNKKRQRLEDLLSSSVQTFMDGQSEAEETSDLTPEKMSELAVALTKGLNRTTKTAFYVRKLEKEVKKPNGQVVKKKEPHKHKGLELLRWAVKNDPLSIVLQSKIDVYNKVFRFDKKGTKLDRQPKPNAHTQRCKDALQRQNFIKVDPHKSWNDNLAFDDAKSKVMADKMNAMSITEQEMWRGAMKVDDCFHGLYAGSRSDGDKDRNGYFDGLELSVIQMYYPANDTLRTNQELLENAVTSVLYSLKALVPQGKSPNNIELRFQFNRLLVFSKGTPYVSRKKDLSLAAPVKKVDGLEELETGEKDPEDDMFMDGNDQLFRMLGASDKEVTEALVKSQAPQITAS